MILKDAIEFSLKECRVTETFLMKLRKNDYSFWLNSEGYLYKVIYLRNGEQSTENVILDLNTLLSDGWDIWDTSKNRAYTDDEISRGQFK